MTNLKLMIFRILNGQHIPNDNIPSVRDSISSVHKAPHAIALGDFDENGLLDFITANRDDNTIGIFPNRKTFQ